MTAQPVDFQDIQGLVRFGYGALTEATFLLLKIRDAAAARAWLAGAPVSTAEELPSPPRTALQVAFTAPGLQALGLSPDVLAAFSPEFVSGMAGEESRSRRLGDIGANAPEKWRWGGSGKLPDMLVMLYAQPGQLQPWTERIKTALWNDAFEEIGSLATSDLDGTEPFGFVDGISQPGLDWERGRSPKGDQIEYGNVLSLGEFLLGYPNEYGKYTDRPLIDPQQPLADLLWEAENAPAKRDLGRNGTYLVFRHLQQDVRGFWQFCAVQSGGADGGTALAESMVGRKMSGDPLVPVTAAPIAGIETKETARNNFTYDRDPRGTRCPFGAHIRRANPRNADVPGKPASLIARLLTALGFVAKGYRDDVVASTRFHRILRRGREYGPELSPEQAIAEVPDTGEHGLHFISIGANISRQFEFVQNAWIMSSKFDAVTEESDPLLGNRQPIAGSPRTDTFSMPREEGVSERVVNVPQFITVRGGAYFFLPSLAALRYFSQLGDSPVRGER